ALAKSPMLFERVTPIRSPTLGCTAPASDGGRPKKAGGETLFRTFLIAAPAYSDCDALNANLAFDPEAARAILPTNDTTAADHAVRSLISFLAPATVRPAPLVQYSIRMSRTVGSVSFRPANRTRSAAVALTSSVLKSAMVTPPNQTRYGTLQSHDRRLQ